MRGLPGWLGIATVLAAACGGRDASTPKDSSGDGGAANVTTAGQSQTASGGDGTATDVTGGVGGVASERPAVMVTGAEPIPEAACPADAEPCSPSSTDPGADALNPLTQVVRELAEACEAYCGEVNVGMRQGCATALQVVRLGVISPQTPDGAAACLTASVVGRRWDCAPTEGWTRAYIDSCTVAK